MKKQNTWEKLFDDFMDLIEMGLVKTNEGYFHLKDYTSANLGNIESEEFDNAEWLFERLDNYIYDYIVSSIEECLEEKGYDSYCGNYQDLINYCKDKLPDSKWDLDVLDMICNHFKDIDLNNCTYEEE